MVPNARRVDCKGEHSSVRFTIGTLVTNLDHYEAMRRSFAAAGFSGEDCEYLWVDNTAPPTMDAFAGLTRLLNEARGEFVVLCHQDVRLTHDKRAMLEARLADLESLDPSWAVAGNAGGIAAGKLAVRISDPHGTDQTVGQFPSRVSSLDENFIIVKHAARIGLSRDLQGFHFYGSDMCLTADILGYTAYVIDFHLQHLSPGRKSADFYDSERAFRNKWSRALRPRWLQTTCSLLLLSGEGATRLYGRGLEIIARKVSRRLPGAQGWRRSSARA